MLLGGPATHVMTVSGSARQLAASPFSDFARNSNSWGERAHIFLTLHPVSAERRINLHEVDLGQQVNSNGESYHRMVGARRGAKDRCDSPCPARGQYFTQMGGLG